MMLRDKEFLAVTAENGKLRARIAELEARGNEKLDDTGRAKIDHELALVARIAELEALILDVHEDLCCQTNYDDKIGFDKLDAEVSKIKARAAYKGEKE